LNRELSWLEFNRRVLEVARRSDVPVLERLKFVAIASSNLDEFYMVRVGGLERQLRRGTPSIDPQGDDYRPKDLLREIGKRARELNLEISLAFMESVIPELKGAGIRFLGIDDIEGKHKAHVEEYYRREVHPCLTPIAIDPAHP